MPKPRKTWRQKLADSKGLPKTGPIEGKMTTRWGTGTMVVPAPSEVDALMKRIPLGRTATLNDLRARLARKHGVGIACPLTTGIFAWIAAHAAEEARDAGEKEITPWWRTLKNGGQLNPKFPGGIAKQKELLEAEGHLVVQKGQRFFCEARPRG
ncbi:MAG: MGMT family protein [Verrucomicrobiales bacterium]